MTNLEKLTQDIRAKLPRLMELTEGCLLDNVRIGVIHKVIEVQNEPMEPCILIQNPLTYRNVWEYPETVKKDYNVIGREPMLNDVLEWLSNHVNEYYSYSIGSHGYLMECALFSEWDYKDDLKWDLSKPYLRDQSQELIDYLAELI
jgi:hypothetical protein